jgi:Ca2+ transporting ATPase
MPPRQARSSSKGPAPRSASKGRKKALDLDSVADVAHALEVDEVLAAIGVDPRRGLKEKDVAALRDKYGPNELPKEEGKSLLALFLEQFDDPLVKTLLFAAAISLGSGILEQKSEGIIEFTVIMVILLLNAGIGVFQEKRAEDAIDALQSYNPEKAKVCRDGKVYEINSSELVPSDIVEIHVGDQVPADIRLISMQSTVLKVEQAALTGESASVNKNPNQLCAENSELQNKDSIMFSGTDLVYGKCTGVVIKTGSRTEIGKIAKQLTSSDDEDKSPLKEKLDDFGEMLQKVITVICVLCWAINIFNFGRKGNGMLSASQGSPYVGHWGWAWGYGSLYYFKEAVALAVAAIPEGLPAVVTTCLALGTRRMAKRNALIRHLPAVETLGCTSVICSDKTGTLTTNMMSVQKVLCYGKDKKSFMELDVDGNSFEPSGRARLSKQAVFADDHEVLYQVGPKP